ncbi:MAG: VOC family protein [Janthinobacterium lividum]
MFQTPHARLLVSDFPVCFRFYRDVLGLTPRFGSEDDVYTEFKVGDHSVALFRRELMAEAIGVPEEPVAEKRLGKAVVVFAADNVDDAVKTLREKGIAIVAEPTDREEWGCRTAHFRDPDGNLIEIYHALST